METKQIIAPSPAESELLQRMGWTWREDDGELELLAEHIDQDGEADFQLWFRPGLLYSEAHILMDAWEEDAFVILFELAEDEPKIAQSRLAGIKAFGDLWDELQAHPEV